MRAALNPLYIVTLLVLAAVPPLATVFAEPFYMDVFRRIIILALAAASLDLIVGYAGLLSFGHVAYIGIGSYTVGVMSMFGLTDGLLHVFAAVGLSVLFALATGAVSMRVSGAYFIMITLAFSQIVYFLGLSLKGLGGDDGMILKERSRLPWIDLNNDISFYYLVLAVLAVTLFVLKRLVRSRFGVVLRGVKQNERRMLAVGFPTLRYKLTAFAIAGAICGLAGVLLANHSEYVSPDAMHWSRSGDMLVMIVLGGVGTIMGPVFGTGAYVLLEVVLSGFTKHWHLIFGPLLLLLALRGEDSFKNGWARVHGWFSRVQPKSARSRVLSSEGPNGEPAPLS